LDHELPWPTDSHRADHLTGIGTGGTALVPPPDDIPLSPIAPESTSHGVPHEPRTIQAACHAVLCRAQDTTSLVPTGLDSGLDVSGTPHPDVKAVPYKAGPSLDGSAERLISTAIEYATPARPSVPRRYSAPTCIKSRTPLGTSDSAAEDEGFEA